MLLHINMLGFRNCIRRVLLVDQMTYEDFAGVTGKLSEGHWN